MAALDMAQPLQRPAYSAVRPGPFISGTTHQVLQLGQRPSVGDHVFACVMAYLIGREHKVLCQFASQLARGDRARSSSSRVVSEDASMASVGLRADMQARHPMGKQMRRCPPGYQRQAPATPAR
jgi:hypothetical protein